MPVEPERNQPNCLYAAIDIGTHSVRLLVAGLESGSVVPVHRELITTRLGEGLSPGMPLPVEAQDRTLAALAHFRRVIQGYQALAAAVATSAAREASDGRVFALLASEVLGCPVQVIDGHEEAYLSYQGAISGVGLDEAVLVDVGGGSTELVYPHEGQLVTHSFPIGAVRCTAVPAGREELHHLLTVALPEIPAALPLVGVGGTVTTLAAVEKKMPEYDADKIHGSELTLESVEKIQRYLSALDLSERRKVPGLQPERADVILAGIEILTGILVELARKQLIVSEADLLYGLVLARGVDRRDIFKADLAGFG